MSTLPGRQRTLHHLLSGATAAVADERSCGQAGRTQHAEADQRQRRSAVARAVAVILIGGRGRRRGRAGRRRWLRLGRLGRCRLRRRGRRRLGAAELDLLGLGQVAVLDPGGPIPILGLGVIQDPPVVIPHVGGRLLAFAGEDPLAPDVGLVGNELDQGRRLLDRAVVCGLDLDGLGRDVALDHPASRVAPLGFTGQGRRHGVYTRRQSGEVGDHTVLATDRHRDALGGADRDAAVGEDGHTLITHGADLIGHGHAGHIHLRSIGLAGLQLLLGQRDRLGDGIDGLGGGGLLHPRPDPLDQAGRVAELGGEDLAGPLHGRHLTRRLRAGVLAVDDLVVLGRLGRQTARLDRLVRRQVADKEPAAPFPLLGGTEHPLFTVPDIGRDDRPFPLLDTELTGQARLVRFVGDLGVGLSRLGAAELDLLGLGQVAVLDPGGPIPILGLGVIQDPPVVIPHVGGRLLAFAGEDPLAPDVGLVGNELDQGVRLSRTGLRRLRLGLRVGRRLGRSRVGLLLVGLRLVHRVGDRVLLHLGLGLVRRLGGRRIRLGLGLGLLLGRFGLGIGGRVGLLVLLGLVVVLLVVGDLAGRRLVVGRIGRVGVGGHRAARQDEGQGPRHEPPQRLELLRHDSLSGRAPSVGGGLGWFTELR